MEYALGIIAVLVVFILVLFATLKKTMQTLITDKARSDRDVKYWSYSYQALRTKATFEHLSMLLVKQDPSVYYDVLLRIERNKPYQSNPEIDQQIDDTVNYYSSIINVDFCNTIEPVYDDIPLPSLLVHLWQVGYSLQQDRKDVFVHTKDEGQELYIDPLWIEQCNALGLKSAKDTRYLSTQFFYKTWCKSRVESLINQLLNINAIIYQRMLQENALPEKSSSLFNGAFEIVTNDNHFLSPSVTYKISLNNTDMPHIHFYVIRYSEVFNEYKEYFEYYTNLYAIIDGVEQPIYNESMMMNVVLPKQTLDRFKKTAIKATQLAGNS